MKLRMVSTLVCGLIYNHVYIINVLRIFLKPLVFFLQPHRRMCWMGGGESGDRLLNCPIASKKRDE